VNTNNVHNHLIAGPSYEVDAFLSLCRKEGALHINKMPVACPYHSSLLKPVAEDFRDVLEDFEIADLKWPMLSSLDQHPILTASDALFEMSRNLHHHVNWLDTMNSLSGLGTSIMFECGAGESLSKTAKFIEGDFKVYPIKKIESFFKDYKSISHTSKSLYYG
jgi:[acyl-carrier-protein] S-malonyltransferase